MSQSGRGFSRSKSSSARASANFQPTKRSTASAAASLTPRQSQRLVFASMQRLYEHDSGHIALPVENGRARLLPTLVLAESKRQSEFAARQEPRPPESNHLLIA